MDDMASSLNWLIFKGSDCHRPCTGEITFMPMYFASKNHN